MPDEQPVEAAPEPECGFGKCDPTHSLHCCHTAYAVKERIARNSVLCGWRCTFCKKESRGWVLIRRS